MNAKLQETILANVRAAMTGWPLGTVVWHRGSGERGVVYGYTITSVGGCIVAVSFGAKTEIFNPFELSRVRPPEDVPGEEWKSSNGLESS